MRYPRAAYPTLFMSFKTRLFVILWLEGMAGVLSFLLVDLSKLIEILPVPAGTHLPSSIWVLKLLTLIQPTILLSLAVFVGVLLASKIGLSSPLYWQKGLEAAIIAHMMGHVVIVTASYFGT